MSIKKSHKSAASDPSCAPRLFDLGNIDAVRSGVTRIPVVVHVVWNTAAQNISDAQIASQINVLNRDYRRAQPEFNHAPAPFLPLKADVRIEFFLATLDPQDGPSNGIERHWTSVASFGNDDGVKSQASGGANAWPVDRYLNIWVCHLDKGLLGHAQCPAAPARADGVVISPSAFGTIGTATPPFHLGRTASHEIGRWLNLNQLWGYANTGAPGLPAFAEDRQATQFFV